ncbi:DUF2939 domain-containing protein [Commensalibacter papalotli (ex Botero et al. 2024)]|uniref:DUF2939 domain-containing protein n=1 Tax=Commensalibacter papalotli (ex Botero et al. 2024) TaxID=2972766 RepID=A0ABM9HQM8_9PROT|nr:DUF2939 domain-containing protein [Commensalibacter papalotli (ex Botero et al. 2024)]CAI3944343.1 unnamed protein product [Commensalibacter papalotli (ex Botero et al. 2024)]CAI3946557.1 unnamed protein product [Commensalibacter papalotli (ex Botero et al. 2024)]
MFFSFLKKWKLIFILAFLGGLYIAYPYMTLWSITKAIETHDTKKLLTYLDWHSIKNNLQTDLAKAIQNIPSSEDDLPDFGNSFAVTAVSNAVDHNLTPDNLTKFINRIKQDASRQNISTARALLQSFMATQIRFLSPTSLRAVIVIPGEAKDDPIQMTLRLEDWKWKVTSFRFSEQRTFQLFKQSDQ